MIKEKELPKAVVNNKLITHKATDLTIMSYDKNVHKLIIPTDLTQAEISDIIVLITFRYHENMLQISGELVEDKIEIILPNEIRSLSGEFYIEIDINLTDNRQITFERYRANVVKSDIDSVDLDDAPEFYFELFDDLVQKVADKSEVAVEEIDEHKQSALTNITQATSDVTDASTQFTADLADTQSTIDTQVTQAQDSLQEVSDTLTAVNDKAATVNDTADVFTADVATKQADVTSKYNAFDASVTTANQTITDILTLTDDVQQIGVELNEKANKTQEAWITPTLLSTWVNSYDFAKSRYFKDQFGVVHLEVSVKRGTVAGVKIMELPAGYRPSQYVFFSAGSTISTQVVPVSISPSGVLECGFAYALNVSFSISFKAV